ncbi:FecR family protein [Pedobacter agri]|uniref:FecR family protein n=1 Tax=Pedobacter agri TaxID=454586 RepID=A0A9X3DAJ8_9SPHI|nr:FecR family protein [Pedobacter agri]MCX3263767.1 FecR family protein [Pedobacter agri]
MGKFFPQKDLQDIIKRYVAGHASAEEIRFIEEYYNFLGEGADKIGETDEISNLELQTFKSIQANIASQQKPRSIPFYKYAAAAALLITLSTGWYFLLNRKSFTTATLPSAKIENLDILPGTDKATLTLANGTKIVLDDETPENISDRHGVKISKTKDGLLVYTVAGSQDSLNTTAYNTISTPKGGQYQVILPDGTKVWLNAASSLKYPEVFSGKQRSVTLTGEAYFEVAKNKAKPFEVETQNQHVVVLGTHFNINGYMDDHTIKTTLLEGQVKVSNLKSSKILKPGEQAIAGLAKNSTINVSTDVDINDETAWKNGLFQFNDSDLKIILNQLERWYNIKIDYSTVPNKRYNGMVPRKSKLSEVLKMLEKTGNIKFELIEGRQLKVIADHK